MGKGESYHDVKNLWCKCNEKGGKNPPRKSSYNSTYIYPQPDYSMDDHHIMHAGRYSP